MAGRSARERTTVNNILIIDDNIPLLEVLAALIGTQFKDCSILTARNGMEGITTIDSVPVAFILTDLDMPVMDGYGVINHRNKGYQQVPLVVMSGGCSPEVREKLGALGVTECIEKPFYFEQIKDKIALALNVEPSDDVKNYRSLLQPAQQTA
jgi:two-component system, chemotaxis family, chemotaxis protein CheY